MRKILSIIILIIAILSLSGCRHKQSYDLQIDTRSQVLFENVMRVQNDCTMGKARGDKVYINGAKFRQNSALRYCLEKNMLDTSKVLKKVYIHRITDERPDTRAITYIRKNGKKDIYNSNPRLEVLFYMFLDHELRTRGILPVDDPDSAYAYRLDFRFTGLNATYNFSQRLLSGGVMGDLRLENIRIDRSYKVDSYHTTERLYATRSTDFDFFVALLIKHEAMKVAHLISKL
ncbi:MAG: hypothetical protein K5978_07230 [Campylobacter sp.]|nr:hypothetical protein [Campylobacter sp.]